VNTLVPAANKRRIQAKIQVKVMVKFITKEIWYNSIKVGRKRKKGRNISYFPCRKWK
jgi:hypothetical protein